MKFDVVRAWKDEAYRLSLSDAERSSLPANPVGEIELTEADLEAVYGGGSSGHRGGGHNSNGCHNSGICSGVCSNGNCNSFVCSIAFVC